MLYILLSLLILLVATSRHHYYFFFVFIVLIEWQKIYAVCFGFALLTVDKLFQDLTFVSGYNVIF